MVGGDLDKCNCILPNTKNCKDVGDGDKEGRKRDMCGRVLAQQGTQASLGERS